jgi:hypothetical protein
MLVPVSLLVVQEGQAGEVVYLKWWEGRRAVIELLLLPYLLLTWMVAVVTARAEAAPATLLGLKASI